MIAKRATGAQVGAAFLGTGFMASVHTRAARASGARLVGVHGATPATTADGAEALGVERGFDSLDDLLADPAVDVVHVCTPNNLHFEQAMRVVEAGLSVVCEKPLTTDAAQARRLRDAASAAGVVTAVPFAYRFHPMVREARSRVLTGEVGRVLSIEGAYLQDWLLEQADDNWRVDGAEGGASRAFADIGSHLVDMVEFVSDDRILRITTTTSTVFDTRGARRVTTEDIVAATFVTVKGAVGTLLVSQVAAGHKNQLRLEVAGTKESVAFDQENPDRLWVGGRSASRLLSRDPAFLSPDAARLSRVPSGHVQGYQDAFNGFVGDVYAAVAGAPTPAGLPTFDDGVRAVELTEAVLASALEGRWIDVAPSDVLVAGEVR